MQLQTPSPHKLRPPAEHKWTAELALANPGTLDYEQAKKLTRDEMVLQIRSNPGAHPNLQLQLIEATDQVWESRWENISQLRVSGPIRAFLFKLTHRRLPLLSQPWIAGHYGRPNVCLLCSDNQPESYSHVFSDCRLATMLWTSVHGVTRTLGGNTEMDQRPARLLGDLSNFSVSRIRQKWLRSFPTNPPPGTAKVIKWLERTWGEVRAVVLKSIWEARCDLLHNNVESRNAATALASSRLHQRISSIAYRGIPSRRHLFQHPF